MAMVFMGAHMADLKKEEAILVAEDDENDLFLIRRAFQKAQLENPLHVVQDGEAAIDYLKGELVLGREQNILPITLVLLDIKMPRINGFEVLTWIRGQPEFNHLPVVMLTSSQESSDINRAYALGANSYLVKPASFATLVEMMNRLREYCSFTKSHVGLTWI
jgi:CheY-like chemotaxis protein